MERKHSVQLTYIKNLLAPLFTVADSRIRRLTGTTAKIYAISLVTIPISTRLFGPEHFGVLNTFIAILCVLLIPSMLKLEIAVGISRSLIKASMLSRTAFVLLCGYCFCLEMVVIIISTSETGLANEIREVMPFLPIAVFGAGLLVLNAAFLTASGKAEEVNGLQYSQLVTTLFGQIAFGLAGFTKFGLLVADVLGRNVRTLSMMNQVFAYEVFGPRLSWRTMVAEMKTHWRYPAFIMTGNLGRYTLSYSVPIVVFHAYGAEAAGFLAVAQRLTGLPRTVVGTAFNATLTSDWREAHLQPDFLLKYQKISRLLLVTLGVMIVGIAAVMSVAAPLILGPSWGTVGIVVCLLGSFYFLDAHLFSLTAAVQLRGLQSVSLFSDLFVAVAQFGGLYYAVQMDFEFLSAVALLGGMGTISLLVVEIVQYQALRRSLSKPEDFGLVPPH